MSDQRFYSSNYTLFSFEGLHEMSLIPLCLLLAWQSFKKNVNALTCGLISLFVYLTMNVAKEIAKQGEVIELPCQRPLFNIKVAGLMMQGLLFAALANNKIPGFFQHNYSKVALFSMLCSAASFFTVLEITKQDLDHQIECGAAASAKLSF